MKARSVISLIAFLMSGFLCYMSVQMTRQGFQNRRIAAANSNPSAITMKTAIARLSAGEPAIWGEFTGTVEASPQTGWAWVKPSAEDPAIPVKLKDVKALVPREGTSVVRGMVKPMTAGEKSELSSPPNGQQTAKFVLYEGAKPPGWIAIWVRIIGGMPLTGLLGLMALGNLLRLFGLGKVAPSNSTYSPSSAYTPGCSSRYNQHYSSSPVQSCSRSEVRSSR